MKLFLVLLCSTVLVSTAAQAQTEWTVSAETIEGNFRLEFQKDSIENVNNITRVLVRAVPIDLSKRMGRTTPIDVASSEMVWDVDCSKRRYKQLKSTWIYKNGRVSPETDDAPTFVRIDGKSIFNIVLLDVCKIDGKSVPD